MGGFHYSNTFCELCCLKHCVDVVGRRFARINQSGQRRHLDDQFFRHVAVYYSQHQCADKILSRSIELAATSRAQAIVPKGLMRIAQRFNVGFRVAQTIRPGGTVVHCVFSRPSGTWRFCLVKPNAQALGYCRMSLRDKNFTMSVIFLRDDDSLAFTRFDNSLTALALRRLPGAATEY